MFRNGLLLSTALVIFGAISFLGNQTTATARAANVGSTRDKNNEFLCTYGHVSPSSFISSSSGTVASHWRHAAMPITGTGKIVHKIIVREARGSSTSSSQFSATIRENKSNGRPGHVIASGTRKTPATGKCATVSIPIPATTLKAGKTYWIEETVPPPPFHDLASSVENQTFWAFDPEAKRKAIVKYRGWYSDRNHSSVIPWTEQTYGVYARVK
jgi:hypothetical protein